jgi:hypothetical protein
MVVALNQPTNYASESPWAISGVESHYILLD